MNPFNALIPSQSHLGRLVISLVVFLPLFTTGCMTYRVNSLADAPDTNPGDRKCERAVSPGSETGRTRWPVHTPRRRHGIERLGLERHGRGPQRTLSAHASGGRGWRPTCDHGRRQDSRCRCRQHHHRRQPCRYCALCPKRGPRAE